MSTAIDANALIYSLDLSSPQNAAANAALADLFRTGEPVWIFAPVILAFLRVSTHPKIFGKPFSLSEAFASVRQLLASSAVEVGLADDNFLNALESVALPVNARGKLVHDAEIVALMKQHGVDRILTADRDFLKFQGITVTLLDPQH